ncbi:unnamed protein product [Protopolystoma xenopodis]|uniref:CHD subfamily II SANT-like domain-containing protein n=1 Tax=Protopolystoma xenopodis TaxID=117903 RepID=A0A448WMA8_9PLAT|nr:unnamed protein product [Protopolystoma xenopodis]
MSAKDEDDEEYDERQAGNAGDTLVTGRRLRREREGKMPPLLSRVNGQLEVFGFNSRQRRSFLNAVMRYGLPPTDQSVLSAWNVRDLKGKSEKVLRAYINLFMRHLCEPETENAENFSDGVPREGQSNQHILTRIGIMALVRKKVQEFEKINGRYSLPDTLIEVDSDLAFEAGDPLADGNNGVAKEPSPEDTGISTPTVAIVAASTPTISLASVSATGTCIGGDNTAPSGDYTMPIVTNGSITTSSNAGVESTPNTGRQGDESAATSIDDASKTSDKTEPMETDDSGVPANSSAAVSGVTIETLQREMWGRG